MLSTCIAACMRIRPHDSSAPHVRSRTSKGIDYIARVHVERFSLALTCSRSVIIELFLTISCVKQF